MQRDDFRPSVLGTLAQQWAISRALWADYFQCRRQERQRAKARSPYTINLGQPGHQDTLYWVLVAAALVCACLLVFMQVWGVR